MQKRGRRPKSHPRNPRSENENSELGFAPVSSVQTTAYIVAMVYRITYRGSTLQQVLLMAWTNVVDRQNRIAASKTA